jgi:hypothetical protein
MCVAIRIQNYDDRLRFLDSLVALMIAEPV